MMTKEEVAQVIAYCDENKISYKQRLSELGISPWSFYDAKLDNNLVENAIRPLALGRKNYLFCGNHDAAVRAAIVYSLVDSCKALDVNPREWMEDVLLRIPGNEINREALRELLPDKWAKQWFGSMISVMAGCTMSGFLPSKNMPMAKLERLCSSAVNEPALRKIVEDFNHS